MVHILRQKIDDNVVYLLVGKEPTAEELKKMEGIEYVENLNIHQTGQYTSAQLKELLGTRYEGIDNEIEMAKNRVVNLEETKMKLQKLIESLEK